MLILGDDATPGPKIRTGRMKEPFFLGVGDECRVTPEKIEGTPERFQIKYETMLQVLNPNK